jgi:dihydrofolate reductase
MRKIVHAIYVSLDGVVDEPTWTGPYFNDELASLQHQLLFASDALLLGRVTYEGFAASWPTMTHEGDFAERMNRMPKYVASRALIDTTWNATLLSGDAVTEVARLKEKPGGDLLVYGSQTFADALTARGLIDEYRIMLFPAVVGSGTRLFTDVKNTDLELAGVITTSTGVAVLSYRRAAEPGIE